MKSLRDATKQAAFSLGFIGKSSAHKKFKDAARQVADSLGTIGKASVSKEVIKQIIGDLTKIGKYVAEKGNELEDVLWEAVLSLESVGIAVANRKEHGEITKDVIKSLGEIGKDVYINLELKDAAWQIAKSMGSLGFVAAEKGKELETVTKEAAKSLGELGKKTAAKGEELETVTKEVVRSLGVIGEIVNAKGKRELIEVTIEVIKSLKTVGEAAVENTLEETGKEIADFLGEIGEASAEKGVDRTTSEVVSALKDLGSEALKDFTDFALLAVYSLGVVGKSAAAAGIKLKKVTDDAVIALNHVGKTAPSNIKDISSGYIIEIAEIAIPLQKQRKEIEEDTKKFLERMGIEISQRTSSNF
jgi:predicted ArsR family transcriptional regulator